jgi:hypothetical protein
MSWADLSAIRFARAPETHSVVGPKPGRLSELLFWFIAAVLVFVVPLGLVLGAVFVSSWGIPLPIYVAIP